MPWRCGNRAIAAVYQVSGPIGIMQPQADGAQPPSLRAMQGRPFSPTWAWMTMAMPSRCGSRMTALMIACGPSDMWPDRAGARLSRLNPSRGEPDPSIWARRYVAGQGWSTPTLIESNPGFASFPHVGFDDSGNAMVVWYQAFGAPNGRHIWANRYVVGTGWRTPTRIDSSDRNGQGPALAVNGNGNAVAVWHQWDDAGVAISIWANEYVAGQGWGTATLIETDSGAADNPDVAIDSGGNAIAVWRQFDGTADSIYANRYLAGQGWGTPAPIETGINGADIPRVAIDGYGNAIAIWQQKGSIWANRFASASSALTPTALTFTDVSTAAGFFGLNSSWCAAWGEYDHDGNRDVMTLGQY